MNRTAANFPYPSSWISARCLRRGHVSGRLRNWLLDESSLTQRLQQICGGDGFGVRVLSQAWQRPSLNEALALDIPLYELALVREVYLLCGHRAWVFARTVIPRKTLQGPQRRLAWLGSQPLGSILFADPRMQRGPLEVTAVSSPQNTLWGRRSRFCTGNRPLLVSEFFLPDFFAQRNNGQRDG